MRERSKEKRIKEGRSRDGRGMCKCDNLSLKTYTTNND